MGWHTWFYIRVADDYVEDCLDDVIVVDGKKYREIAKATNCKETEHDAFRVSGVHEDVVLKSLEETLEFFKKEGVHSWKEGEQVFASAPKKVGNTIVLKAQQVDTGKVFTLEQSSEYRVRRFFENHPDGIITFG